MADDTRIVQMQFENRDFEKNIATSQKSLDRFKESLDFEKTSRGLQEFGKAVKSITFENMANNLQKLTDKFTGLGTAAEFVLSRVRRSLENMGDQILSFANSLTTVQAQAGFVKYESLNKSVQTLKAATGKEEKEIYGVLERLNKYTDQTSYDFAQGVSSISKLVSSGAAGLTQAEKTIEGFYNMAAKAGADTQTASHALQYSLTQAMSMGYMGYNDWKTLEGSSLATKDFKTQLLEAAVALGKVTKQGDKYYTASKKGTKTKKKEVNVTNLWKDSLQEQWITTDVLNKALEKYADTTQDFGKEAYAAAQRCTTFTDALNAWKDQMSTGWMQAYRTVFGDLADAIALFSGVCDKFAGSLDGLIEPMNKVLEVWREFGGRDALWGMLFGELETPDGEVLFEGAYGVLDSIQQIGAMISDAWWSTMYNLIPKSQLDKLNEKAKKDFGMSFEELWNADFFKDTGGRESILGWMMSDATQSVQEFVESIHEWFSTVDEESGTSRLQKLQAVLDAIFNTISFGFQVVGGIVDFFGMIGEQLEPSIDAVLTFFETLGNGVEEGEVSITQGEKINQFFSSLAETLRPVTDIVNTIVPALTDLFTAIGAGEQENGTVGGTLIKIGDAIKSVFGTVISVVSPVTNFIGKAIHVFADLFRNGFDERSMESASKNLVQAFQKMTRELKTVIKPILTEVGNFIKTLWETIYAEISGYFNDPNTIGYKIIDPVRRVLTPIFEFLKGFFGSFSDFFQKVKDAFTGKLTLLDILKVIFSEALLGGFIGKIVGLLKGTNLYGIVLGFLGGFALWKLIKLIGSWKEVGDGLNELMNKLKHPIKSLMGGAGDDMESFGAKFLDVAKGIALIAAAVVVMGSMGWEQALTGLTMVVACIAMAWGTMKLFERTTKGISLVDSLKLIGGFIAFATSMVLMATALRILGGMSWESVAKGIVGLGAMLVELVGFMVLLKGFGVGTGYLSGFAGFALSIGILIASLQMLKNMSWEQFGKMTAGLGGVLIELLAMMVLMKGFGIGTEQLGGFIGFAVSLTILILTLQSLKDMNWTQFGKMMAGLGGVLAELYIFMLLTKKFETNSGDLGSFIGFALSLAILVFAIKPFANMDWEQYARVMAGLGGVLVEMIATMYIAKKLGIADVELGSFIGFAVSLAILVWAIKPFANMDWEQYARVMAGLGGVLVEMIGFMVLMRGFGLEGIKLGGFIGFAASIAILIFALQPFASMDWEQYGRVMAGLGGLLAELLIFMAILKVVPVDAGGILAVIAIAASISIMAIALSVAMNEIRNLKWEAITAFTSGLAVVMLAMAGAVVILGNLPASVSLKGIAVLTAGIAAIMGVIALMAPMLMSSIGGGAADMAGKLELISGMLSSFSGKMDQVDEGSIDKAGKIFDKLKELLGKLSGWGQFTGITDDFAYAMFALGTGMEIFNYHVGDAAGELDDNAQSALKFIQDLSACAGDLDTISKFNMDNLIAAITGLGGAMSIYAQGAKEAAGLEVGETPNVDGAMTILREISSALTESGGFTIPENMPSDTELGLFGAQLAALATALVKFEQAGAGLGTGTEKALGVLAFFQRLKSKLTETAFAENLGATIGIFDKNEVTEDQLTRFGVNIEQLGLALKAFAASVTVIDGTTGEMKDLNFDNAIKALESFAAMESKLGIDFGPVITLVWGRQRNLIDLGSGIEALGTAMSDFSNKLSGVDENGNSKFDSTLFDAAIEAADKVAEYLKELQTKMGRVGGLWNGIIIAVAGRNFNFTDLKTQMEELAKGIGSLGQLKVDDKLLTVDDTTGIFNMLDSVIKYMKKLEEDMGIVGGLWNGVLTAITGHDYNFGDLKGQLISLGQGLNGLTTFEIEDLPTKEEMEKAFPMIDSLIDYMNALNGKIGDGKGSVGGVWNTLKTIVTGREFDFTDLEKQLSSLGKGLGSLSTINVDSEGNTLFNPDGTGAAITMVDALITYMTQLGGDLQRVGGLRKFFEDLWSGHEADFQYIGTQLGYLGDGLGKFQEGITKNGDFDASKVSEALGALDHLVSMMQTFSVLDEKMDAISQSYGLSSYTMRDFMINLWDSLYMMSKGIDSGHGAVVDQLAQFVQEFDAALVDLGGLENVNAPDILDTVARSISTLVTAARNMQLDDGSTIDFNMVGQNISSGIAAGIAEATGVVEAAARAVVKAAVVAANAEADSNSPSRVFMTVGGYMGQGLAIGFQDQQKTVEDAATGVMDGAIKMAGDAMATFASLMSQEIDANPTITPVLDLSNITAGSAAINGLLSGEKTLSLAGAGSSYSSNSIPRTDRPTSEYTGQDISWIKGSIEQLGNRINDMGERISNLQIVMNTGALVGELSDGIDRSLGKKSGYSRRRN